MSEMTPLEAAEILKRPSNYDYEKIEMARQYAASCLRKIAAGEYKPVVHGHWINYYEPLCSSPHANCSVCSHLQTFNEYCGKIYAPQYCENCGALMDGKDEEN